MKRLIREYMMSRDVKDGFLTDAERAIIILATLILNLLYMLKHLT